MIGLLGGVAAQDYEWTVNTDFDTINPTDVEEGNWVVEVCDTGGGYDWTVSIQEPGGNEVDTIEGFAGFCNTESVDFFTEGTWTAELREGGFPRDSEEFEVEEDEAEPTVTSTSPNEGEEFSPDTTSVIHSADIDYDGADSVDVTLEVNGQEVTSIDDFDEDSISTAVEEPEVSFNAGETYNSEWIIERDGEVDDTDTINWELEDWDIQFNNLQPSGDTFSFSDREIDFSVDIDTNADDFDAYVDFYEPEADLEVLGSGISPTVTELSEGTNTVTVESDAGTHDYEWEATIEGDSFITPEQESYTVEEPNLDVQLDTPQDGDTFEWDTDQVIHNFVVDGEGQEISYDVIRDGTVEASGTQTVDGTETIQEAIDTDTGENYDWEVEVEDDYNTDSSETWSYSIEEPTLDVNLESPTDGSSFEWDTENVDHDFVIEGEGQDVTYDLIRDGEIEVTDTITTDDEQQTLTTENLPVDTDESYDWSVEVEDDYNTDSSETRTYSIEEPNIDVSLDEPADEESFVWNTEEVTHSFDITGEGQDISYDLIRDGVIEESDTVSNDGVFSVDHDLPVDTDTSYNWEVDVNDDWNSASSEERTYSIDEQPSITFTDITPDRQQSAEEVTFDLEHDGEDVDQAEIFYPREDFSDVEEDLNEVESGVWTLDHIIPSGTETGTYDVEFRIYSGGDVADTQNEVLEVDNEPPKLSTTFDSEVRFGGLEGDRYIETTVYFNESFEELGSIDVSTVETDFQDSASADEWTEGIPEGDEWNFNEFFYEITEFDGDEIVAVTHRFEVTGDWETEETGIVEYSDDLGNEDEFQNSFDVDTIPPSLDNFEATNLDHPDRNRYVEGDEIEFEIEATDFSDVTSVDFENDAFPSTIIASQDGDIWSGTGTVSTETEPLENQDVTVTAEDDFANTVSESYGSGLEQAPDVELVSQNIDVDEDTVDHSFTTNTQIESGEVGVYGEFRDISEYSESETQDGFQYTATFTEGEQGYWRDRNDNNLDVTDIWGQDLQEKVIPHLVDVEAPTVEPHFDGSFESDTEPRGEIVNDHIRILDTEVWDNVALEEVTVSVNGEAFVQESFPLEPTEEDALDGTGDTINYGEELNLSDMDDSDVIEENEVNTVTIEATDHAGNHTSSETEVYVIGDLPVENVEWTFPQYNRDYGQTNDLEITFDQVEFDWFGRSYDVDIALKKDDTPVEYPRYHDLDSGVADQTVPDNGGDVLYRPMTFGTSLEERGGLRFYVEQEGSPPPSTLLYEDFELTEEAGDSYAPYEVIENEENVTHVWKLDWDDRLLEKDEYDAEITGVLQVEESVHDNEQTIEESFQLDEVIDFERFRAISDTEKLSTEFRFRSRDNLTLNQLEVERVVDDEYIEIQGYRYEYDGEDEEFVFQEEVYRLQPRTWNDLEEDPVDGDEEWRFDYTNTHPDWTVSIYSRGGVGLVGDTGSDDIRMEVATLSTGSTSDEEVFDGGSSVSTSDYETVFEYRNPVFDEEDVELENSTNFFSNRLTYSTGDIEDLRRGEMKARFNLLDDTGNTERIERPFEIRENTFEGNFYQFFDNRMAWSDTQTGLALAGITIVGGVVIINLWLGGLVAALYGIGSSVLWLFSGFLPLSVNLLLAVLLAGGITVVAKRVIS